MLALPDAIISLLNPFASMFQAKTWLKARVLLVGTVLATRRRKEKLEVATEEARATLSKRRVTLEKVKKLAEFAQGHE